MNNDEKELYHHGILGQKWGIRRYQNEDGSLTRAGQLRYNYKDSEKYKNADDKEKRKMEKRHSTVTNMYGKKYANKFDYQVIEKGKNPKKLLRNKFIGTVSLSVLLATGPDLLNAGLQKFNSMRTNAYINNLAVEAIKNQNGLNEVKGGFTFGFGAVSRGKKIVSELLKNG